MEQKFFKMNLMANGPCMVRGAKWLITGSARLLGRGSGETAGLEPTSWLRRRMTLMIPHTHSPPFPPSPRLFGPAPKPGQAAKGTNSVARAR